MIYIDKLKNYYLYDNKPQFLENAQYEIKNSKELFLEALNFNYYTLKYASNEIRNSKEINIEAIKIDTYAL